VRVLSIKVPDEVYKVLESIASQRNTTVYSLVKAIIVELVRRGRVEEIAQATLTLGSNSLEERIGNIEERVTRLELKLAELEAKLKSRLEEAEPKKREEDWKIVLKPSRK